MEKRVQRRKNPQDELKLYWNQLLADKQKLAAWARKMKLRKMHERIVMDMKAIEEEVKSFTAEKVKKREYYSSFADLYPTGPSGFLDGASVLVQPSLFN